MYLRLFTSDNLLSIALYLVKLNKTVQSQGEMCLFAINFRFPSYCNEISKEEASAVGLTAVRAKMMMAGVEDHRKRGRANVGHAR